MGVENEQSSLYAECFRMPSACSDLLPQLTDLSFVNPCWPLVSDFSLDHPLIFRLRCTSCRGVIFTTWSTRRVRLGPEELVIAKLNAAELEGIIIRVRHFEELGKFYMQFLTSNLPFSESFTRNVPAFTDLTGYICCLWQSKDLFNSPPRGQQIAVGG